MIQKNFQVSNVCSSSKKHVFVASFPTSPGRDVDISCNQSAMICEGISSVQVTNAKEILEIFANNFREPWLRMGGRSRVGWIRVGFWLWHGYGDLVEVMMWRNYSSKSGVFFFKGMKLEDFEYEIKVVMKVFQVSWVSFMDI